MVFHPITAGFIVSCLRACRRRLESRTVEAHKLGRQGAASSSTPCTVSGSATLKQLPAWSFRSPNSITLDKSTVYLSLPHSRSGRPIASPWINQLRKPQAAPHTCAFGLTTARRNDQVGCIPPWHCFSFRWIMHEYILHLRTRPEPSHAPALHLNSLLAFTDTV